MGPVKAIDRQRMRSNFSVHAAEYDQYAAVQKRVVQGLCEHMGGFTLPSGPLLDIGTGTGSLAAALLERDPMRQILVMDIAHGMTCAARQRMPGLLACDGDARNLPFADQSFASVVSSSVYQWVDCLPRAFSDVARVLRPDGLFALAVFGEKTLYELRSAHRAAVAACGLSQPSHVQSFPSRTEVAAALASAGLHTRLLVSRMEVESHSDVPNLLRQLKHIGASNAAADRPRGLASRRVMQEMVRRYQEDYGDSQGVPASYEVIIAVACRLRR